MSSASASTSGALTLSVEGCNACEVLDRGALSAGGAVVGCGVIMETGVLSRVRRPEASGKTVGVQVAGRDATGAGVAF
jgi:hypothetical protein